MPAKSAGAKPRKPYPDFPLFPHATGRWAKKIRGKLVYFGPWEDPDGALAKYRDQRDDLQAGRKPRDKSDGLTVREAVNRFLTAKRRLVESRELSPRTLTGYHSTGVRVADFFGKDRAIADLRSEDFEAFRADLARTRGPVALAAEIRHTRILFKYTHDSGLIDSPVRFGPSFKPPSRRLLRQTRQAAGPRMFEARDLQAILAAATEPLRSMVLLGINGGFGQTDCATLPRKAIDLDAGWLDFPRPKTAVPRKVPLWPETVEALREALPKRPRAKDKADEPLAFLTRTGKPWVRTQLAAEGGKTEWSAVDSVGLMFGRLLESLDLKRPGLNFYALRHTFETIAGETRDQVAVNAVMGHDDASMASLYRERIGDERLRAIVEHVRSWAYRSA